MRRATSSHAIRASIGIGVTYGTILAAVCSALGAIGWFLGGETALRRVGIRSPTQMVATYLACGLLGGIVFGLLHRLRRFALGYWIAAVIVAFVVYFIIGVSANPDRTMGHRLLIASLAALATGTLVAVSVRRTPY